jgi:hypothetical protein
LINFKKLLKDESGAVQLTEAAFVYPVIMIAAVLMVYAGIYAFETAYLSSKAHSAAVMAAGNISFAGTGKLTGAAWTEPEAMPSAAQVNAAYEESSPYRYILPPSVDPGFVQDAEEYAGTLIIPSEDVRCSIDTIQHLYGCEVVVTIEKELPSLRVGGLLGIGGEHTLKVQRSAFTSDPAELVRNTDLIIGIADKCGTGEKLESVKKKISEFTEKIKTGG